MDARSFDALAKSITSGARLASRRRFLRGLAALAAVGLTPGVARAFDGGPVPVQPAVGGVACASGADCAAGEICLNGVCTPRQLIGDGTTDRAGRRAEPAGAAVPTQPVATGEVPSTISVTPPETTPAAGVGGLIQPGEPLPARIYAGRCGSLGAEPAFQLIDIGAVEGVEEGEAPQGALTAIPAEFSTTVVNVPLAELLETEHAVDVRVVDTDPATSIACGDIGGPVETGPDGPELAIGLQERGQSAYSGIAWLQDEEDRTLVRVFLARGLDAADAAAAPQAAPADAAQPAPTATAAPAVEEEPQAAATPAVGEVSPLGAGARVVTTIDVNLRAAPAEDAAVVTILGQGVELEVTAAPVDGWVPVVEPGSAQAGFVSDQFVTIAE